ncbi:MAG: haloacid dehalogenase-like hydrolase [Alphaproteobacteria bacterium]|nr:haloacid dehalogenase-like hydrolase [Alphaproteobacteria bacterium]
MKNIIAEIAICYDFDGTLIKGNMQEPTFIKEKLGLTPNEFWSIADKQTLEQSADSTLSYMKCMLDEAKSRKLAFKRDDFVACGENMLFFKGVTTWFERINEYAAQKGIKVSHYIISSGLQEMVEGTKIAKYFTKIYASSFMYDEYGRAVWPDRIVNYTDKTQYLARINKGCLDPMDIKGVNKAMPKEKRPVPYSQMIYFGDGETDVPSMSMIKNHGGYCFAVYTPNKKGAKEKASCFLTDGRVDFVVPADYSAGKRIEKSVKGIIDKIAADKKLEILKG